MSSATGLTISVIALVSSVVLLFIFILSLLLLLLIMLMCVRAYARPAVHACVCVCQSVGRVDDDEGVSSGSEGSTHDSARS
jgi:hypothetical protein